MRDGLYKVAFKTPLGEGAGVAYLHGGAIHGGDSMQYYAGDYRTDGSSFTANVTSKTHSLFPGMTSVFGVSTANITLRGTFEGDTAQCEGSAREAPGIKFAATLSRLSD